MSASQEWVTVESFPNRGLAEVAGSALASAGIAYRVRADDAYGMGFPLSFNGAEVQTPPDRVDEARGLLGVEHPVDTIIPASDDDWSRPGPDDGRMIDLGIATAAKVIAVLLLIVVAWGAIESGLPF